MRKTIKEETLESLKQAEAERAANGWACPKWITFARHYLERGIKVESYYAKTTVSKYIYLTFPDGKKRRRVKVRFSNHKPNKTQQQMNDSDYYIGVSHDGVMTTEQAMAIIDANYLGER